MLFTMAEDHLTVSPDDLRIASRRRLVYIHFLRHQAIAWPISAKNEPAPRVRQTWWREI